MVRVIEVSFRLNEGVIYFGHVVYLSPRLTTDVYIIDFVYAWTVGN